jgi:hypothetical protein
MELSTPSYKGEDRSIQCMLHTPFSVRHLETHKLPRKEKAMSTVRQRMIEDMQLDGYSAKTQTAYLGAVRGLAGHYHRTPENITHDELRSYFLYLVKERDVTKKQSHDPSFRYQVFLRENPQAGMAHL